MKERRLYLFSVLLLLLLAACSASTVYRLNIDGLSFIAEHQRSNDFSLSSAADTYLYLLPGFGRFDQDLALGGTGELVTELRRGFLVQYPAPDAPAAAGEGELQLEALVGLDLVNKSASSGNLSGEITLHIADKETENIYSDGQELLISSIPEEGGSLIPGESGTVEASVLINEDDPAFDLLLKGSFRCGIEIRLSFSAAAEVRYTLEALYIKVQSRPFAYIP